jgi:ABC-type taurine transport system ATPase subunit
MGAFAVVFFGIREGSAFFLIALGAFFPHARTRSLMQQELLAVWQRNQRSVIFITHNIERPFL